MSQPSLKIYFKDVRYTLKLRPLSSEFFFSESIFAEENATKI